jgi:hypothetical protein
MKPVYFMLMDVNDNFSFEKKNEMDKQNKKVQQGEKFMWEYQQPLPGSAKGEKWKLMNKIKIFNRYDDKSYSNTLFENSSG